jgi:hypothetical protein
MSEPDNRSIPELFSAAAADLAQLVKTESELIRAELSEKISAVAIAAGAMGAAAILILGGFLCFLAAAVIGLSYVMPAAWAALLVGIVSGLVGYTFFRAGAGKIEPKEITPELTVRELRKDAHAMKEQM